MFRSPGDWIWNCSTSRKIAMSALKSRAASAGSVQWGWASTQVATLSGSTTVTFLTFFLKIEASSRGMSRSSEGNSASAPEVTLHRMTTFFSSSEGPLGSIVGSNGWRK